MNISKTSARITGVFLILGTVPICALWLIIKGFDDPEITKAPVCQ